MHEISNDEREYLLELLKHAHDQMLHEMHHTDSRSFRNDLRERIALNERLTKKLSPPQALAV